MFSKKEYETLSKFRKCNYVSEEDKDIVYRFSSIGYVRRGFSTLEGEVRETAKLTSLGREIIDRERILRSPIKKVLYYLLNSIY